MPGYRLTKYCKTGNLILCGYIQSNIYVLDKPDTFSEIGRRHFASPLKVSQKISYLSYKILFALIVLSQEITPLTFLS
jgi:hypothetical protein